MKFMHTADWQIGMKFVGAGDRGKEVRAARLDSAQRAVQVANERAVDFVVVAGDLFDNRTPSTGDLGRVVAILSEARMPVFVLPGNHDPAGARGPYASDGWARLAGSRVTTIGIPGSYPVPGGILLAAPCEGKYGTEDPTEWFRTHETDGGLIRVGLAHGSLQLGDIAKTHAGDQRGGFPISPRAASLARLDYLALGDWHGYYTHRDGNALIAYSGTPEQSKFGETESGSVSVVTIEAPGTTPQIERVPVGRLRWHSLDFQVSDDASIARLQMALLALEDPKNTLVRAKVHGLCTPSAAEQLQGLFAVFCARFFSFEIVPDYAARPETRQAWRELLPTGDLRILVDQLLDRIERGDKADVARRALDILAKCAR